MIWLLSGLEISQKMPIICQTPQPGHFHPACRNLLCTSLTKKRWEISQFLPGPTLFTRCGRRNFPMFIYQRYNIKMVQTALSFSRTRSRRLQSNVLRLGFHVLQCTISSFCF